MFDQIVIGNGSSAVHFIHSAMLGSEAKFKSDKTLVIGKSDLWSQTPSGHALGQTPAILERRIGPVAPSTATETPSPTGLPTAQYETAGSFTRYLDRMRQQINEVMYGKLYVTNDTVIANGVARAGNGFEVKTSSGNVYEAKSVIVASGLGPANSLPPIELAKAELGKAYAEPRDYPEIVDAVTYYQTKPPKGHDVLVYGGSATSAWASSHAWKIGEASRMMWMCRRGIDQISTEGNPVGRNSEVIQMAVKQGLIEAGEIKNIAIDLGAGPGEPRLMIELKVYAFAGHERDARTGDLVSKRDATGDVTRAFRAHQLVYAVGSDPLGSGGPGSILSVSIRDELGAAYAKDSQFQTDPNAVLLAYTTPDEKLWVVGASVFGALGMPDLRKVRDKYAKVGDFLTQSGTPPEGIAILATTLDALTGRFQTNPATFEWSRARPEEIVKLLKDACGLDDGTAQALAQSLVTVRADAKFALTPAMIRKTVADFNDVYRTRVDVTPLRLPA
ncbi:hypothetical protein [Rubrimonas cliftonensis]|uniref:FAD/NAD(P)-binding domain-containing protein n=1 Tax=Rubrimonas cliftonensis TaxID=89524 RepID=A0A1H4C0D7_9RHOB|nr:hypothetical protein [Rubrimonas cliftonensis]SEA53836.1 hypothetical protein SAMN05444370_106137 [Rubrimonas cliftonensis]